MTQLVRTAVIGCFAAFLALSALSLPAAAQAPPPLPAVESGTQYLVFFRSQPVGREEVLVLRTADGWVVRGTSRLGQPIDITTRVAEVDYDAQWHPKTLIVDGIVRGQDVTFKTTIELVKFTQPEIDKGEEELYRLMTSWLPLSRIRSPQNKSS